MKSFVIKSHCVIVSNQYWVLYSCWKSSSIIFKLIRSWCCKWFFFNLYSISFNAYGKVMAITKFISKFLSFKRFKMGIIACYSWSNKFKNMMIRLDGIANFECEISRMTFCLCIKNNIFSCFLLTSFIGFVRLLTWTI